MQRLNVNLFKLLLRQPLVLLVALVLFSDYLLYIYKNKTHWISPKYPFLISFHNNYSYLFKICLFILFFSYLLLSLLYLNILKFLKKLSNFVHGSKYFKSIQKHLDKMVRDLFQVNER